MLLFLWQQLALRGTVFSMQSLFLFQDKPLPTSLFISLYISWKITGFFLLVLSGTPLPYVGVSVTPVTHKQAAET
jgi:hypothetical protein